MKRNISRDRIVSAGHSERRNPKHNHPWIYLYKVKSGTRKTRNIEQMHYNLRDLAGYAVEHHAMKQENLAIYGIVKVMRYQMKSRREDI